MEEFEYSTAHIISNIHQYAAYYTIIIIYIFTILGSAIIPVLVGDFFHYGAPFSIDDYVIFSNVNLMAIIFTAAADQLFIVMGEEIDNIASSHDDHPSWTRNLFINVIIVVLKWQRLIFKYFVLRSQISIIIAVVITDLIAYYIGKEQALLNKTKKFIENGADVHSIQLRFYIICLAEIPMFMILYMVTGMTDASFFSTELPVDILGINVTSYPTIFIICLVIFFDGVVYGTIDSRISGWIKSHIQHPDTHNHDSPLNRPQTTFVHVTKRIVYWLRLIFSLSVLTNRYYFVIVYTTAELVSLFISTYMDLYEKLDKYEAMKEEESVKKDEDKVEIEEEEEGYVTFNTIEKRRSLRKKADALIFGTVFMWTEIIIVGNLLILTGSMDSSYFTWPSEVVIFRNVINTDREIILLMLFGFFYQIGSTLNNDVILPDFNNWLYKNGSASFVKEYSETYIHLILILARFDSWFRFVMIIQFVLSNFYFVVFVGVADIIVGSIIINQYLLHKDKKEDLDEFIKTL